MFTINIFCLVVFAVIPFAITSSNKENTNQNQHNKEGGVHRDLVKPYKFIYPRNSKDERDLPKCHSATTTPCNLVTNVFFFPFLVTRLCRCPDGVECPYLYEARRAFNTVQLNSREQIKFCADVPKCEKEAAILDTRNSLPSNLTCHCMKKRRWKLTGEWSTSDDTQIERYICEKIPKCKDNCGHLRLDNYATYHHCTCPPDALCVPKFQSRPINIREVLYKGKGLVSECTVFET